MRKTYTGHTKAPLLRRTLAAVLTTLSVLLVTFAALGVLRAADGGVSPMGPVAPGGPALTGDTHSGGASKADGKDDGEGEDTVANQSWSGLDFTPIAHLAVQQGGRVKPFDTVAREAVGSITGQALFSGSSNFKDPDTGKSVDACDLYLSIWLGTRNWNTTPLILVGSMAFRQDLGLPVDADKKLVSLSLLSAPSCKERILALYESGHEKEMSKATLTGFEKEALDLMSRIDLVTAIQSGQMMTIVPDPQEETGAWTTVTNAPYPAEAMKPVKATFLQMREAYVARNNEKFVPASFAFVNSLRGLAPDFYPSTPSIEREVSYNHLHPFRYAWLLYLGAALLTGALFRFKQPVAYWVSLTPFLFAFGLHAYGIYLRCMIAGRPPVTNMYESVVWVGAGCAFFGLVFELIHRPRYYMLAASVVAVLTLLLADNVPVITKAGGDIGPLVPVLRDNFWLTVHVLTITLSYAAFTLAWSLGHITLFKHLIHPTTTTEHKELHGFLYRVLMLGVLLLAAGTILGGVWANYSWGRFWGWDPKETWALIALLTYLVVLHGRYTGLWGFFGLSVGSVVCYLSVLMAWYGVNFVLGTGLHSYGFGAADGAPYVIGFVLVDAAFVAAVLVRRNQAVGLGSAEAPMKVDPADAGSATPSEPDDDHPWAKPDPR